MRVIRAIPTQVIPLGRLGENECTQILFDISGWLEEYPSAAIGLYNLRPGDTESYPVGALTTSDGSAVWTVKSSDLSSVGKGRCELVAIEDNVIVKSAIYTTQVAEALDGSGEVPEPWEDWKEEFIEIKDDVEAAASAAQDASEAIQNMGVEAGTLPPSSPATVTKNVDPETGEVTLSFGIPQGVKGDQGDKGDRGYCPTATVTKNGKTATISLTDIDGTTTATITDGNDGFTPIANVVQNVDGAKITITDVNGTTFATVYDGEDGYSPSAAVLKKDYGARISITDKDGTTFADVYNGETGNGIVSAVLNNNYTLTLTFSDGSYTTVGPIRGEKGVGITSIEKTGTSGLTDTYTITFDDGSTTTFNVTNGESVEFHICASSEYDATTRVPTVQNPSTKTFYLVPAKDGSSPDLFVEWIWTGTTWEMFGSATIEIPVQDVQVNGSSIVDNGVAEIPIASSDGSIVGVVKAEGGDTGISVSTGGKLMAVAASNTEIKEAATTRKMVIPSKQHQSVFYGLAKASGDTTQSQSSNPVGTYTDNAKSSIRSMIGATSDNVIAVQDTIPTDPDTKIWLPETVPSPVQVPTVSEMNEAIAAIEVPVNDVQVNNVSVVDANGVANVPIVTADSGIAGVVKVNAFNGLTMNGTVLSINAAYDTDTKAGTNYYKPITPVRQHQSVFYGLTKAAGVDMASSANAVGIYTEEAKAAIKRMLGVTQTLTITAQTQDGVTVTGQTVTVRADDASGEVYATAAYEGQPVSFSLPSGFQYYVSISDTLAHHFNPTTARGVIANADASATLQYSDFSSIHTAADIKAALDANIDLTDLVGESITCTRGTDTLTWDVVDYDATNKRVTLLLHDAFGSANMVFEPAQALMWCENELAAGNYTFKWNSTQVYFTLTTAIPAGGQLRATNSAFSTYESQSATSTLETGTVSTDVISGATDLGVTGSGLLNHHDRVSYGSNNYVESALFWWLNSDAAANTQRVPVTKFSRAYSYNVAGFLNGLDESFVSAIDDAVWKCSTNNVYECPASLGGTTPGKQNSYTVTAKIGLASEMEIFGSYGGTADGSTIFDLYNGATADDRKKYRGTTAQTWWLRSPVWGYAYSERCVSSSGVADLSYAGGSCAVVPACQISQSVGD